MITQSNLQAIFPATKAETIAKFVGPINDALAKHNISNKTAILSFIAQIGHESGSLNFVSENLNYSEKGLLTVFKKYFDAKSAKEYAKKPEKIANRVYANRMGNGDEKSGDGWRYRGAGLIQVTGKNNHQSFANFTGKTLTEASEYARTPEGAVETAMWFFFENNLWNLANTGDMKNLTKRINGGLNGYEDRLAIYARAKRVI